MYQMLIRRFRRRLRHKPAEDAGALSIGGPEAYVRNKIADTAAKEVMFWGESTPRDARC
jgi:hypothetical protein